MKKIIVFTFSLISLFSFGQKDTIEISQLPKEFRDLSNEEIIYLIDSTNNRLMYEDYYNLDEDGRIILNDVSVIPYPKFANELEKRYYFWLKKKLYNAYPFYLKAMSSYENLNDSLSTFKRDKKIKKYIKKRQKQLADSYEEQLKDLSRTEGQILSKLIHRHSGETTYEMLGKLRGSFNAYIWQAQAGLFDIDLKLEFNPDEIREDEFLENIILTGLSNRELISVDNFKLIEMESKSRDTLIMSPKVERSALEFKKSVDR